MPSFGKNLHFFLARQQYIVQRPKYPDPVIVPDKRNAPLRLDQNTRYKPTMLLVFDTNHFEAQAER